jgi:hypothetical protein
MSQNDEIVAAIMGELARSKAAIEDSHAYRGGLVASGSKVVEHALRHGLLRVLLDAMGDGLNAQGLHR